MDQVSEQRPPLGISLDRAEFSSLHRKFWLLAALGIMLDGFDFFIIGVAGCCLLGLLVTVIFRIEPMGKSLDEVSGQELSAAPPRVTPP